MDNNLENKPKDSKTISEESRKILEEYLLSKRDKPSDLSGLKAAQQQAAEADFATGMAEAGTMGLMGVLGGTMPQGTFDAARERNKQILNNYLMAERLRREQESERASAAKALIEMEPKVEVPKVAQKIEDIIPDPKNPGKLIKVITSYDAAGNQIGEPIKSTASREEREAAFKEKQFQFQKEKLESGERTSAANLLARQRKAISELTLKEGIPTLDATLAKIDPLIKPVKGGGVSIPGFSSSVKEQGELFVKRKLGMLSDADEAEALQARTAFQKLANMELKSRSGAAVTDKEYRRFLEEVKAGSILDFTPREVENHINLLKSELKSKKDAIRAIYPEAYDDMYGSAKEPTKEPSGTAKYIFKDGQLVPKQ